MGLQRILYEAAEKKYKQTIRDANNALKEPNINNIKINNQLFKQIRSRKMTKKIGMLDDRGVKVDLRNSLNEKLIPQMYLCAEDQKMFSGIKYYI